MIVSPCQVDFLKTQQTVRCPMERGNKQECWKLCVHLTKDSEAAKRN